MDISENFKKRQDYLEAKKEYPTEKTKKFLIQEQKILKRILQQQHYEKLFPQKDSEKITKDIRINEEKLSMLKDTIFEIQQILKNNEIEEIEEEGEETEGELGEGEGTAKEAI